MYYTTSTGRGEYFEGSERPRNIMTPAGIGYTITAAVFEQLRPLFYQAFPEIVHNASNIDLGARVQALG